LNPSGDTSTLITTPRGLPSIITALWELDEEVDEEYDVPPYTVKPVYPTNLKISLNFHIKSSMRREILEEHLLWTWLKLHGIREFASIGNIGDPVRRRLETEMLQEPSQNAIASALREYYRMVQEEVEWKDNSSAQWWWDLFEGYWTHVCRLMRTNQSGNHQMNDADDEDWDEELWTELKDMYFQGELEIVNTYLSKLNYERVEHHLAYAFCEYTWPLIDINYTVSQILKAKIDLCNALAQTAL
jgi:hypothetical protein